ncbi:MAG: hypothetical protein HOV81_24520, partial [Kofleriaceae bacterium]|nr:hypothetical protein [Kofleriaceae bacterium]
AWEEAERDGVPFAQHVQESVTSESRRFDALTPPSAVKVQPNPMLPAAESPTLLLEPTPTRRRSSPALPGSELPTVPEARLSSPGLPTVPEGRLSSPELQPMLPDPSAVRQSALSDPQAFAAAIGSSPYPVVKRPAPEPTGESVGAVSAQWQRAMFIGLAAAFVFVVVVLLATC